MRVGVFSWLAAMLASLGMTGLACGATTESGTNVAAAPTKAADIPVWDFLRPADYGAMRLSPNGEWLASITPHKGRVNLVVINVAKRTRQIITSFEKFDVFNYEWVNDNRMFLRVADTKDVLGRFNLKGSYAVDIDGSNLRVLQDVDDSKSIRGLEVLRSQLVGDSPDMIVQANQRTRNSADVYRFNTLTGRLQLLTFDSPGEVSQWVLDNNDVPRVAVSYSEPKKSDERLGITAVHYRAAADAPWRKLAEFKDLEPGTWDPIAFDDDNKTLLVASNIGRDKRAIYRYDPEQNKLGELLFEDPLVDVESGLIRDPKTHKLLGISYVNDRRSTVWVDPEWTKLQKQLEVTLPGSEVGLQRGRANPDRLIVSVRSDVNPGEFFLFERAKGTLEPITPARPWIDPKLMPQRQFIQYKARDGRMIPAYLTLPRGAPAKNLPLIVNVHGGPRARVYEWADFGDAQLFASRGYAVLEPEPRGSTGFGREHERAGWRQWGLTAQDDLNDGAAHLANQGIVDAKRMCIYGGSYGGYATLQGLARDPDFWACGNAFVAVSDLGLLQTVRHSDTTRYSDSAIFAAQIGDKDKDAELFQKASPARNAARIKAPLMLTMGSDDVRVPMIHGTTMRDAMQAAGKKVDWKVYVGEAHGFNAKENQIDFAERSLRFFDACLKKSP
jgi:dipeptidyl aminopeptidase/acylaminoacyl peptidase